VARIELSDIEQRPIDAAKLAPGFASLNPGFSR
jgi:hypothetical protein